MTTETITEYYCERCGSAVEVDLQRARRGSKARGGILGKLRGPEESDGTYELTVSGTYMLCFGCRGYVCARCWNEAAARCRTCSPAGDGADALPERPPFVAPLLEQLPPEVEELRPELEVLPESTPTGSAWPESDLRRKRRTTEVFPGISVLEPEPEPGLEPGPVGDAATPPDTASAGVEPVAPPFGDSEAVDVARFDAITDIDALADLVLDDHGDQWEPPAIAEAAVAAVATAESAAAEDGILQLVDEVPAVEIQEAPVGETGVPVVDDLAADEQTAEDGAVAEITLAEPAVEAPAAEFHGPSEAAAPVSALPARIHRTGRIRSKRVVRRPRAAAPLAAMAVAATPEPEPAPAQGPAQAPVEEPIPVEVAAEEVPAAELATEEAATGWVDLASLAPEPPRASRSRRRTAAAAVAASPVAEPAEPEPHPELVSEPAPMPVRPESAPGTAAEAQPAPELAPEPETEPAATAAAVEAPPEEPQAGPSKGLPGGWHLIAGESPLPKRPDTPAGAMPPSPPHAGGRGRRAPAESVAPALPAGVVQKITAERQDRVAAAWAPRMAPQNHGRPHIQACTSCALPLSASVRFCRRCGSPQA